MAQKWPKNGSFLDPFRVLLYLEKADIYVNQWAKSLKCSVIARSHSDNSSQREALNGAKNQQKWPKKRLFLGPFRVFLCHGSLKKADIHVNSCARSSECSAEAPGHSDNSLQRKALNGAKKGRKWLKIGIFRPVSRFFVR